MQPESTLVYHAEDIDFARPGKHHYQLAFHLDGSWGYSLLPITVINGTAAGSPKKSGVAAFGGTHGNEYEGQIAVKRLCTSLDATQMRGRVILIPQLSESACRSHTRSSPEDGVNMNRAFPGKQSGTLSYRIAHFVKTWIFPQLEVVVDLHAGGKEAVFPLCTSFHPLPNLEQYEETARVAALFDTPFIFVYTRQMASGLLVDEAEDEGLITIGGEFGYGEMTSVRGVTHAFHGMLNVLRHYGLLDGKVEKVDTGRSAPPRLVTAADLKDYVPSPCDAVWEPAVTPGAEVEAGQVMGRLHQFEDHASEPRTVIAHKSGIVIAMYAAAVCRKGMTLYVIGEESPLRSQ
jgi:predicted deacylase